MPALSGTITKIFIKEKPEVDQYGNGYRCSIKVDDGDWVGLGDLKDNKLTLPAGGKEYREVHEGARVEFLYTERTGSNGVVYKDAKRSKITVLDWGSGTPSKAPAPRPATNGASAPASASPARTGASSGGTDWARKDAGAAASASVDKALAYLSATNSLRGESDEEVYALILDHARRMQGLVVALSEEILAGAKEAAKPAPNPNPAPKAAVPAKAAPKPTAKPQAATSVATDDDGWDDDEIPF